MTCSLCNTVSYGPVEHVREPGTDHAYKMECQSRLFHLIFYCLSRYLTFQHVYFAFYRWKPNSRGQVLDPSATDVHPAVNFLDINYSIVGSTNTQWKSTVSKMTYVWTVVVLGATLFLPITVALILHPYIFDRIYLKLTVTVAFLLSAASGTSASILLAHKERLRSVVKREAWIKASKSSKTFSSIDFWTGMSWPLTTLTWAVGLCLMAVLSLATSVESRPMSKVDVVVVGVIAIVTVMVAFGQSYRVFNLAR